MAEGFRIPVELNQEYRVKLGKSFTFPKENAFHSIKYDFKPKSIDPTQPGRLKVKEDEVSVFMPVMQAESAEDVAVFKGAGKPCRKECILIINTETGEAVLEKINNTVNLKGVRKKFRSTSPIPTKSKSSVTNSGNSSVASKNSSSGSNMSMTHNMKSIAKKSKSTKKKTVKAEKHPIPSNSGQEKHALTTGSASKAPPTSSNYQSNLLTLPTSISPLPSNNPTTEPHPPLKRPKLSNSSKSDSDSTSSSSSSNSDSDSEMDHLLPPTHNFTSAPPPSIMPVFSNKPTIVNNPIIPTSIASDNNYMMNMPSLSATTTVSPDIGDGGNLSSSSESSSSSSSSGGSTSSSDSDSSEPLPTRPLNSSMPNSRPRTISVLKKDLELSDSDDSD